MNDDRCAAPGALMGELPRGIGPADWEKWEMLPAVRLSQAVLLSIGGEPDDWPECGIQEVGQSLLERRRIALSHVRAGQLPLLELCEAEPIESTVSLAEFAAWAQGLGWQLPAKFPCCLNKIRYGDLPYWLATRQRAGHLFKDQLYRGMLRANWESDLRKAVQRGQLQVRTPATHEPIDIPHADGVVLSPDLRVFLDSRGLADLLTPIESAETKEASMPTRTAALPETGKVAEGEPGAERWRLKPLERADDLRRALHAYLSTANKRAAPPTASDVLSAWMANKPSGVTRVTANEVNYLDASGVEQSASLKAVADRIKRCIERVG